MKNTIVIGLGNMLMSDEGIGILLLNQLEADVGDNRSDVEFADLGAAGMRTLHALAGRRKAILIDCALMDQPPGTIKRFTPENVRTIKKMPGFSLHEGDIMQVIALSRQLGEAPDEIVIFGIEPAQVEPSQELSPALAEKVPEYLEIIRQELKTIPYSDNH